MTVFLKQGAYHRRQHLYGGMKATEAKRLKELELGNTRLKRLLADVELDKAMVKCVVPPRCSADKGV